MEHHITVGKEKIKVEMGCYHPDFENRNCSGKCEECKHGKALMSISDFSKMYKECL